MQAQIMERLSLENDLRRGITEGEFCNFYQPLVDLRSGHLVGFEVLARWNHPQRGWISPARFIPIAEETGLIHALGRALFEDACRQLQLWQADFPDQQFHLNINVSPVQFGGTTFVHDIRTILANTAISGKHIRLELTESALLNDAQAYTQAIFELLDMDLRLCIDDFGTGYSSLTRLHAFPIATVKVDQSFVRQMNASEPHLATVRVIVALAQMLGMNIVAEGIESAAERDLLLQLGCTIGQGYFFSRPLSIEAASAYLLAAKAQTSR
jgi:EAL domain-containing protein (putative c-di-GMP-specific phosphodiesterase class I)